MRNSNIYSLINYPYNGCMTLLIAILIVFHIGENRVNSSEVQIDITGGPTTNSIYDLSIDPYEKTNLYSDADYASYLSTFESLREYWTNLTVPQNTPDQSSKGPAWKSCGYVCPWITDTSTPRVIEQLYDYSEAPNIVFVLVDDWGFNDFGKRSTYLSWTTPTIDRLADEGILLDNYYTNELCGPSRASLMTGRYTLRLGVYGNNDQVPLSEVILSEELKSAGYRSYVVGKWHLGESTWNNYPLQRGFDYFYGYVEGDNHYWSKKSSNGYLDLFENNDTVTNAAELDETYHAGYLYQSKAESAIQYHSENYPDTPMFLYYALQLVHAPWTAPDIYISRCTTDTDSYVQSDDLDVDQSTESVFDNYCAMNLMMDEAVSNLTCALEKYGFANNTYLIIAGDNGGESTLQGSSYPYRGQKGSFNRGGITNTAIIHSKLIPESLRATTSSQLVHITGTIDFP